MPIPPCAACDAPPVAPCCTPGAHSGKDNRKDSRGPRKDAWERAVVTCTKLCDSDPVFFGVVLVPDHAVHSGVS